MKQFTLRLAAVVVFAMAFWATGAQAQESFQVQSVDNLGCNSGDFDMTVLRSNLDGGTYFVRTVVTVGALIYMNEQASVSVNGTSNWSIFNNFSYGAVPNPGTYPIPSGQQMRLDFTLERPVGSILYAWTLIVTGCDTGGIIYNGLTALVPSTRAIPALSPGGLAALAIALLLAFAWIRRRGRGTHVP